MGAPSMEGVRGPSSESIVLEGSIPFRLANIVPIDWQLASA